MTRLNFTVLLLGAAVAVGFQNYIFFSKETEGPKRIFSLEEDELTNEEADFAASVEVLEHESLATWLFRRESFERNPFLLEAEAYEGQEVPQARETGSTPQLNGTLWSRGRRIAWIDGRPRSEGDWIGRSRIARIDSHGVVMVKDGIRIPLSIQPTPISGTPDESDHAN